MPCGRARTKQQCGQGSDVRTPERARRPGLERCGDHPRRLRRLRLALPRTDATRALPLRTPGLARDPAGFGAPTRPLHRTRGRGPVPPARVARRASRGAPDVGRAAFPVRAVDRRTRRRRTRRDILQLDHTAHLPHHRRRSGDRVRRERLALPARIRPAVELYRRFRALRKPRVALPRRAGALPVRRTSTMPTAMPGASRARSRPSSAAAGRTSSSWRGRCSIGTRAPTSSAS